MNNLPIAKGVPTTRANLGYEILTPNRLMLGRNNFRSLDPSGITLELGVQQLLEQNNKIVNSWFQMFMDRLHLFTLKPEVWMQSSRPVREKDVVIFVLSDSGQGRKKYEWKLARVVKEEKMKVDLEFGMIDPKGNLKKETLSRSPRDVSILFSEDEFRVNSTEYFKIYSSN